MNTGNPTAGPANTPKPELMKAEHHYKHGVRDGISRLYYTTGERMTEWVYSDGKRHGPSLGYFKNGQIKDKRMHKNDHPQRHPTQA